MPSRRRRYGRAAATARRGRSSRRSLAPNCNAMSRRSRASSSLARSGEQLREYRVVERDEQLRLGCAPAFDGDCQRSRCEVCSSSRVDLAGRKCRQRSDSGLLGGSHDNPKIEAVAFRFACRVRCDDIRGAVELAGLDAHPDLITALVGMTERALREAEIGDTPDARLRRTAPRLRRCRPVRTAPAPDVYASTRPAHWVQTTPISRSARPAPARRCCGFFEHRARMRRNRRHTTRPCRTRIVRRAKPAARDSTPVTDGLRHLKRAADVAARQVIRPQRGQGGEELGLAQIRSGKFKATFEIRPRPVGLAVPSAADARNPRRSRSRISRRSRAGPGAARSICAMARVRQARASSSAPRRRASAAAFWWAFAASSNRSACS